MFPNSWLLSKHMNKYSFFLSLGVGTLLIRCLYYPRYLQFGKKIDLRKALQNKKFNYRLNGVDDWWSFLPFIWIWLDISALTYSISIYNHISIVSGIVIAGRFRALQELTHIGMHQGLCVSRKLAMKQANFFFQYPLFKTDMHYRRKSHFKHHFTNYDNQDPNIQDFLKIGFQPGISEGKFIYGLLYPVLPMGIFNTVKNASKNFLKNKNKLGLLLRAMVCIVVTALFYKLSGLHGLCWGYLFPAFIVYPWFAWIAQVAEHRWFVPQTKIVNRAAYEYANGRVTDYPGITGAVVRGLIFPFGDSYHLAHSLYINAHWLLLKSIDSTLKAIDKTYTAYGSEGLFFSGSDKPSALSELKERLVYQRKEESYEI